MAKSAEDQRNIENNANVVSNAADVAIASKNPYAMAAGTAVKAGDKLTGGKVSETAGKAMNAATKTAPMGKQMQKGLNGLSESGAADAIGGAARAKNGKPSGSDLAKQPTGKNSQGMGRGQQQPSSNSNSEKSSSSSSRKIAGVPSSKKIGDDGQPKESDSSLFGDISRRKKIVIALLPILGITLPLLVIMGSFSVVLSSEYGDPIGTSKIAGENIGIADENEENGEDEKKYYNRIISVKNEYLANGKYFETTQIIAVFKVIMNRTTDVNYNDITTGKIREVAAAMYNADGLKDTQVYEENLKNKIFPKYLKNLTDEGKDALIEELHEYIDDYYDYIGIEKNTSCSSAGSCTYNIPGFSIGGSNISKNLNISNLQVRLMQCGSPYGTGDDNTPINQDLVDFESYAAGVVYAEIGESYPDEAMKAQAIMARSYALARPTAMGDSNGKKLEEENGKWILQIASCVSDQVFCNIDQGCSYMGGGDGQGGYVVSGVNVAGSERSREPLAADSRLRTAVFSTKGELLTNEQGYVISTGYLSDKQEQMKSLAEQGYNYKEILFKLYPEAKNISAGSCSGSCSTSTGEFASWKQCDSRWGNTRLGTSSTICEVGCLATSIAILIAKSGVQTILSEFNPGTFVTKMNEVGGFVEGDNLAYDPVSTIAPQFVWSGQPSLEGMSRSEKLSTIKSYIDQGYYVTAEVKGNTGQHWVAIDSINGDVINMMDPASESTNMWDQYDWGNTSKINVFEKVG